MPASTEVRTILAGDAGLNSLTVARRADITAEVSADGFVTNINNLNANDELIAQTIRSRGATTLNISNNTNIIQPNSGDPLTINRVENSGNRRVPGSSYSVATARFTVQNNARFNESVTVQNNADFNGRLLANNINVRNSDRSATCYGDCPMRTESEQCRQAAEDGYTTYSACMNALR